MPEPYDPHTKYDGIDLLAVSDQLGELLSQCRTAFGEDGNESIHKDNDYWIHHFYMSLYSANRSLLKYISENKAALYAQKFPE
jgi:hypothetical protein